MSRVLISLHQGGEEWDLIKPNFGRKLTPLQTSQIGNDLVQISPKVNCHRSLFRVVDEKQNVQNKINNKTNCSNVHTIIIKKYNIPPDNYCLECKKFGRVFCYMCRNECHLQNQNWETLAGIWDPSKWCKMKTTIPCEKMQHRLTQLTVHMSSLSCKASSDVQHPTHDTVRETQQFDHELLARLCNKQLFHGTQLYLTIPSVSHSNALHDRIQVLSDINGPCDALRHTQLSSCCVQSWMLSVINRWQSSVDVDDQRAIVKSFLVQRVRKSSTGNYAFLRYSNFIFVW